MKKPVAIIGAGEIGGVFARGLLKLGNPVYPITRGMNLDQASKEGPEFQAVIVAVGEKDFHAVMNSIPQPWRDKLVLIQNELLPKDWTTHHILQPTVISVWFEKKQPKDFKVIIPSPVFGSHAQMVSDALGIMKIPTRILTSTDDLLFELVLKNLYIITTNVCGLKVGGTVGELWKHHQEFARTVAEDVLNIQFKMIGKELNKERLIESMVKAFEGDLDHVCMGRSAQARLQRAIEQAQTFHVNVPALEEINAIAIKK
ncbi:MAG: hypothetical protein KBD53_08345 [Candidatus Omnitrophica bacterium]|nr:hypothetical protein [Candidatus Omnitrophota bacterium]